MFEIQTAKDWNKRNINFLENMIDRFPISKRQ